MSIWSWTLEAYSRPDVPDATLALQDAHGQNTPFLLWAVWAEGPPPEVLAKGATLARAWEAEVLSPIRAVRRRLKEDFAPVEASPRLALREDIKAAELRAERLLMETLADLVGQHKGGAPALAALEAASAAWGRTAPLDALARLAGPLT
jgi:uncharacterized protein (TIGR02444 family)